MEEVGKAEEVAVVPLLFNLGGRSVQGALGTWFATMTNFAQYFKVWVKMPLLCSLCAVNSDHTGERLREDVSGVLTRLVRVLKGPTSGPYKWSLIFVQARRFHELPGS